MAINKFYIKKWTKMIFGKSILHVNQGIGQNFKKNDLCGYYNDLREKVTKSNLSVNELPITELPSGEKVEFSIAIFQYGLGAYDLYISTNNSEYYERFMLAVNWAISHQESNGGWISFASQNNKNPFSSMAQGEGASLLLRAYKETNDISLLKKSYKAIKFMMTSETENGCTYYDDDNVILKEFPLKDAVLNGWIFSIFGLYDYLIVDNDKIVKKFYDKTIASLKRKISDYDVKYWSKYDSGSKLASPFYHKLHIDLLKALYELTGESIFKIYFEKFEKYNKNKLYKTKAFIIKSLQKIKE